MLPVHLFGQLADVTAIKAIAEKHNLLILEDSAQNIYSHHNGTYTGNFGIASGISFYVTKNLGAAGDGGMILTNDDEVHRRCLSLRIHGMGRERYYYDEVGYTSRLAELQAAVLVSKIARLDDWHENRNRIANYYLDALKDADIILPRTYEGNNHVWHQFTIQSDKRDGLMEHLKEKGIGSAIFYPVPLHLHSPYAMYANGEGSLPITEIVSKQCLSIPVHQHMTLEQAENVANEIKAFVGMKQVAKA
ncbi:hypothetical protein CCB80_01290 [Armatimonadetes bacterium Uphvl-Ar1]|nr:hypothetical protein CCB80_01290 [Armatimonadetes bacterium Uphvl-Ar1]